MRGDLDFAFGRDEFEHLVGDDFNSVALRLEGDFAFGGECFDAETLAK